MPVMGQEVIEEGNQDPPPYCTKPAEFIGCMADQVCAGAITYACMGKVKYELANSCVPSGYGKCDAPQGKDAGNCK
jgi:hypothetical protein